MIHGQTIAGWETGDKWKVDIAGVKVAEESLGWGWVGRPA
jgi:hypothetical protein